MASLLASLKFEFIKEYLDQDCLGLFQDEKGNANARSDNPLLIAAYGWAMLRDELERDKIYLVSAISNLEVGPDGGMLKRRPNADMITEAHDNMDAGVALDILSGGESGFSERVCLWGSKMGFQYSNVFPKKYSWKQLRQPGSICFYKIGAGWVPYPLECLALTLGMVWAMLFGWSSTHNLAWLKLRTIPVALKRQAGAEELWGWVFAWWGLTEALCWGIHNVRKTFRNSWKAYFGPDHILTRMAKVEGAI